MLPPAPNPTAEAKALLGFMRRTRESAQDILQLIRVGPHDHADLATRRYRRQVEEEFLKLLAASGQHKTIDKPSVTGVSERVSRAHPVLVTPSTP